MIARTMLITPIVAALALGACSTNGPDDALTGTWSDTNCYGSTVMPADIQSCTTALVFAANLSATLVDTRQSMPATAVYPRCTAVRRITGQQFSTVRSGNGMTFTVTGAGSATLERTGCVNEGDNLSAAPTTVEALPTGSTTYQLAGNTLTILSGRLAGAYTRATGP